MKRQVVVCLAVCAVVGASSAFGQGQEQQQQQQQQHEPGAGGAGMQGMDWTRMGPWTRKPTNEAQTRKEIQNFFKEEEALMKRRDLEATIARVDFPVYMLTDDSKGEPKSALFDREEYTEMTRQYLQQMPADLQITHQPTITVLSDSLAVVTDEFTMTMGGQRRSGKSAAVLVKRGGQWKWKSMIEAGWGDTAPATGGAGMHEEKGRQEAR
jgi:hypothetical protein